MDQVGDLVYGCVRHASQVLAAVEDARVYPGAVAGAAVEAFHRAQSLVPFAFAPADPEQVPPAGGGR